MRAIGIILAGGNNSKMKELSNKRAVGAMPIAGSYRAIDFALSNMSNSHIQKVAVLTQYNALSLNEHLSSSKWWDFGRKQGGLFVFTPSITADNGFWYRGTADAIAQNIGFLKKSHEPYVVIASGDGIYKLDYNKVLEEHVNKQADITIVCKRVPADSDKSEYGVVKTDDRGFVTDFVEKPIKSDATLISTGVYVIRRRLLISLIEKAAEEERYDFVNDILQRQKNEKKIIAYVMDSYWKHISTVDNYFEANMDFLNPEVRNYFFKEYPDVYSKVDDLPPAKYNPGSNVRNSLVSSGCIINGTIESSILFKQAYVGNNTIIKNSIILNDVYIGDNVYIENCIIESHDTIKANTRYVGGEKPEIIVERNFRYGI
ncbi:MAG: glucose-1-phosphate adenylyltransferase subunit GlgD [Lachnospiraceae bacterium]|nr:glucose-1-phosphate adenylyltransferase subunit GlgD [Lachnospiraceae bacterium]